MNRWFKELTVAPTVILTIFIILSSGCGGSTSNGGPGNSSSVTHSCPAANEITSYIDQFGGSSWKGYLQISDVASSVEMTASVIATGPYYVPLSAPTGACTSGSCCPSGIKTCWNFPTVTLTIIPSGYMVSCSYNNGLMLVGWLLGTQKCSLVNSVQVKIPSMVFLSWNLL